LKRHFPTSEVQCCIQQQEYNQPVNQFRSSFSHQHILTQPDFPKRSQHVSQGARRNTDVDAREKLKRRTQYNPMEAAQM
jgi:phenylalanine-4-hydroxylase